MRVPSSKDLVIVALGANSEALKWISAGSSKFDIVALCYEEIATEKLHQACQVLSLSGKKFDLLVQYFKTHKVWQEYDYIFLPDDDLIIEPLGIESLFSAMRKYDLQLAQPALTRDSYYSHRITRTSVFGSLALRYTNFVEIMCPIFSARALKKCYKTFAASSTGYGLDYVWPQILLNERIAIVEAIPIIHRRKIRSWKAMEKAGIDPHQFIKQVISHFGYQIFKPRTLKKVYEA